MRVLVCGGRDFNDKQLVFRVLNAIFVKRGIDVIIQGDAKGADILGKAWAEWTNTSHEDFPALWDDLEVPGAVIKTRKNGRKCNVVAGFQRNQRMIDEGKPDLCVAFPGGNGTADMIRRCKEAGIKVVEVK